MTSALRTLESLVFWPARRPGMGFDPLLDLGLVPDPTHGELLDRTWEIRINMHDPVDPLAANA